MTALDGECSPAALCNDCVRANVAEKLAIAWSVEAARILAAKTAPPAPPVPAGPPPERFGFTAVAERAAFLAAGAKRTSEVAAATFLAGVKE